MNAKHLVPSSPFRKGLPLNRRNEMIVLLGLLALLLPLLIYICFWNLGVSSFGIPDESSHVQATQGMVLSGKWWQPTIGESRYFNKPPFKMWLTMIPTALLGESNFSYRLVDGLLGVGTVLLTFFFGRMLFRSSLVGFLSALALLSCDSYVFNHGIRVAVQDGMLIFLTTLALILGWFLFATLSVARSSHVAQSPFDSRQTSSNGLAVAIGIIVGLAVFTKTVAGYLTFIILGVYALLGRYLVEIIRTRASQVLLVLGFSLMIPTMWFLPHCLLTENACSVMFGHEVLHRAKEGIHNTDDPWFYLTRIFIEHAAVPPELLVLGLMSAIYFIYKHSDRRYLFLVTWAVVPVVMYSIIPSRLTWYIAPSFPAMSILIGRVLQLFGKFSIERLERWWSGYRGGALIGVLAGLVVAYGIGVIGYQLFGVVKKINEPKKRIVIDEIVGSVLEESRIMKDELGVVVLNAPRFDAKEATYVNMLRRIGKFTDDVSELDRLIKSFSTTVVFAPSDDMYSLIRRHAPYSYRYLKPFRTRKQWMVVGVFGAPITVTGFTTAARRLEFAEPELDKLFGLGEPVMFAGDAVRFNRGDSVGIRVVGDRAHAHFGSVVQLRLGQSASFKEPLRVEVYVNALKIGSVALKQGTLVDTELRIPPRVWQPGYNAVIFSLVDSEGNKVDRHNTAVAFSKMSMSLCIEETPCGPK